MGAARARRFAARLGGLARARLSALAAVLALAVAVVLVLVLVPGEKQPGEEWIEPVPLADKGSSVPPAYEGGWEGPMPTPQGNKGYARLDVARGDKGQRVALLTEMGETYLCRSTLKLGAVEPGRIRLRSGERKGAIPGGACTKPPGVQTLALQADGSLALTRGTTVTVLRPAPTGPRPVPPGYTGTWRAADRGRIAVTVRQGQIGTAATTIRTATCTGRLVLVSASAERLKFGPVAGCEDSPSTELVPAPDGSMLLTDPNDPEDVPLRLVRDRKR
ncbi:hypothetical protein [Streptomyces sp. NPDC050504]|uniref:hypothetical protein n=1 Tax=Streptomyces sp. NPDC050504 TaxID=3365618 RepID=UPI0037B98125